MEGVFDQLQFWHWWIIAIILLILEMLSPGVFFMWIGLAAGVTGAVLLALPELGWEMQFVIFALASVLAVIVGKVWFTHNPINSEQPALNERSEDLIGKTVDIGTAQKVDSVTNHNRVKTLTVSGQLRRRLPRSHPPFRQEASFLRGI